MHVLNRQSILTLAPADRSSMNFKLLKICNSIEQTQDGCTPDLKKMRMSSTSLNDWTLGCQSRPNQEEPKGIEVRDTHMKEDWIFRTGVANANLLHSHIAIAFCCSSHAWNQSVMCPIICGCGCTSISAHLLLGAYHHSIYRYKHMRLLTRVYSIVLRLW